MLPNGGGAGGLLGTTGAQCDPHMGVKEEVLPRLLPHMGVGGGGKEAKPATVCVRKVLLTLMVMVTGCHNPLQPCSRAARKWIKNKEMKRKWRENEEMQRKWRENEEMKRKWRENEETERE